MLVSDLLSDFRLRGTPRSRKPYLYWIRWSADVRRLPAALLARPVAELRRTELAAARDQLIADGFAPASAGMSILSLSAACRWAVDQELIDRNPCAGISCPPSRVLIEHLEEPQIERLLRIARICRPDLVAPIALGIWAGLRHGELAGAHLSDVHYRRGRPHTLHVCRSWDGYIEGPPKNGDEAWIPIGDRLADILHAWRHECPATRERLLCPAPRLMGGEVRWGRWQVHDQRGIRTLFAAARIPQPERPWHMLRHTAGTLWASYGGTLYQVADMLRHRDPESARRYTHLEGDPAQRELVGRVAKGRPTG